MESQPQNPEFRNNPENFHPCRLGYRQIPIFQLVAVAERAGLSMSWSVTLKTDFLARRPIIMLMVLIGSIFTRLFQFVP